jgi:EAL domain-containing protein (putative c-di-GMP-specific phosphodiesterase class I)
VRELLEGDQLRIVFQPIADLNTGAFVGAEALSRFPDGRTPPEWFAEADGVGLREELELLAASAAIKERSALPDGAFLAVNLSPDVAVMKASTLTRAAGPGLVIEVTEHAAIDDYELVEAVFDDVRGSGTRFAIDDVGAGFASLRHILQLRPELIKIDASLTHGIEHDRSRRALALGLTAFAEEFGATIVAEGIESDAELEALRAIGITYGQGYHIARPTAASDLTDWQAPV